MTNSTNIDKEGIIGNSTKSIEFARSAIRDNFFKASFIGHEVEQILKDSGHIAINLLLYKGFAALSPTIASTVGLLVTTGTIGGALYGGVKAAINGGDVMKDAIDYASFTIRKEESLGTKLAYILTPSFGSLIFLKMIGHLKPEITEATFKAISVLGLGIIMKTKDNILENENTEIVATQLPVALYETGLFSDVRTAMISAPIELINLYSSGKSFLNEHPDYFEKPLVDLMEQMCHNLFPNIC